MGSGYVASWDQIVYFIEIDIRSKQYDSFFGACENGLGLNNM